MIVAEDWSDDLVKDNFVLVVDNTVFASNIVKGRTICSASREDLETLAKSITELLNR